jgi:hypothetical protein
LPPAALVTAIDSDGTVYCLSEYYQPGLTPSQHMDNLYALQGFIRAESLAGLFCIESRHLHVAADVDFL